MSETNNLRALLMAALVVMSVFAGVGAVNAQEGTTTETTTDAPTDTATETNTTTETETNTNDTNDTNTGDTDATVDTDVTVDTDASTTTVTDGDVVFQGETIEVTVDDLTSGDENLVLRDVTGDSSSFVTQLNPEEGSVEIDTSDLEGQYLITNGSDSGIEFEVAVQSLQANWSEDTINQGDNATLELESNRNGYFVNVSADNLDASELNTIFGDSPAYVDTAEVDGEDVAILNTSATEDISADLSGVDAGNYEFDVQVNDTTASDTASIEVTETDTDVNFAQSVYSEQVGDVVEMSVEMQEGGNAYVFIGGNDVNYLEAVEVTDGNDDGVVNFTFNTYTANTDESPFQVVGDNDDEVSEATIERENGDALPENLDGNLSSPLEPGDYDLRTSTTPTYNVNNDQVVNEQDVATLDLSERNTSGISTLTAPSGNVGEYDNVQELLQNANQSDNTVAIGDRLVVQVNASGLSGIINEENVDSLLQSDAVSLTIAEASAGANSEASALNLDSSNTEIYQNETGDNNRFFVVVDTSNLDNFEDDTEYETTFTLGNESVDESPIAYVDDGEEESVSTTFTAENPDATVELNNDDQFEVAKSQNAQVQFDTNLAGGSEVSVRMRSSASNSAFLLSNTVETNADGSVNTTFDTSNIDVGTEFSLIVRSGSQELANEDGIIVQGQNGTGTGTAATVSETTDTGATPVTETSTAAPGETPSEGSATPSEQTATGTSGSGTPGFGVVVAVTALLAAALLAVRRD